MIKIPNFKENCLGHLDFEFGIYLGFEFWDLEFEVQDVSYWKDAHCSAEGSEGRL